MTKDKVTERPWRLVKAKQGHSSLRVDAEIRTKDNWVVMRFLRMTEREEVYATQIVTAVNERDQLLAEVARLQEAHYETAAEFKEAAFALHVSAGHLPSSFATCMHERHLW